MAHVGEETGSLGVVMQRMERHYARLVQARRTFLGAIAWPMFELGLAAAVIGLYILAMGWVAKQTGGPPMDLLGLGLIGPRGLTVYLSFLLAIGLAVVAFSYAMRRGVVWVRPIQRALIHLPVVGTALSKLALSQMAWALHLTMNVALDMKRVAGLALRATGNDYYIRHMERVTKAVGSGQPLVQALAATGTFPSRFLDALAVGEESGQVVEAMSRLANQYEDEAESAVRTIAMLLGVLVFFLVAGLLIFLIFRFYGNYFATLNELMK
jgi:type II secretory pathway component PulF